MPVWDTRAPRDSGLPPKTQSGFEVWFAGLAVDSRNGQPVAQMKRDGINRFSGTLADGTPA
ncbi:MAG: hypothetical protein RID59_10390 [Hoeflea sp.]